VEGCWSVQNEHGKEPIQFTIAPVQQVREVMETGWETKGKYGDLEYGRYYITRKRLKKKRVPSVYTTEN